jgi:basic membrane protein A
MAIASIDDVLMLIGVPLLDQNKDAKARFRRYVAQLKWTPNDYRSWLAECLAKSVQGTGDPNYDHAFRDIVVSLGSRLGLEVEYSPCGKTHPEHVDGLWMRDARQLIAIEVEAFPQLAGKTRLLGTYLGALARKRKWPSAHVHGLYVVGPGDCGGLVAQIQASDHSSQVWLVSVENLLRLIELAEQLEATNGDGTAVTRAQQILFPVENVDLGCFIDLIVEVAGCYQREHTGKENDQTNIGAVRERPRIGQIVPQYQATASDLATSKRTFELQASTPALQIGMLLGSGGLGDRSFNDSAYNGLVFARQMYGTQASVAGSTSYHQDIALIQRWAKAGYDLIIGVTDQNAQVIAQAAAAFPGQRFAILDTEVKGDNVWSAVFREYEGDYVVGVLAALVTWAGRIGFIGGVQTPIIRRIESAFVQGIQSVNPDLVLNSVYANRFDDELIGQSIAQMLYTVRQVDVIYQAAGRSGIGAIRAAKRLNKLIISTGGDHSELAPALVLTNRIKNVYRPVLDVIEAVRQERFGGGQTVHYGFADGGLSLTHIRPQVAERLPEHISLDELNARKDEVLKAVIGGQVTVTLG